MLVQPSATPAKILWNDKEGDYSSTHSEAVTKNWKTLKNSALDMVGRQLLGAAWGGFLFGGPVGGVLFGALAGIPRTLKAIALGPFLIGKDAADISAHWAASKIGND